MVSRLGNVGMANCPAPSAHNNPTEKRGWQLLSRGVFIQFRNVWSQSHIQKILLEKTWCDLGPDLCANEARVRPQWGLLGDRATRVTSRVEQPEDVRAMSTTVRELSDCNDSVTRTIHRKTKFCRVKEKK